MAYDLKPMKAPRAAGRLLKTFVALVENPASGALLADRLLRDAGILALRNRPTHAAPAARHPVFAHGEPAAELGRAVDLNALAEAVGDARAGGHQPETVADFAAAYRDGRLTPLQVAERAVEIARESDRRDPPMRTLIAQHRDDLMTQARASAQRFERGEPLGPFDGVPVAVKDELDQLPYPTTVGTRFLGTSPATLDAEPVARLRRAGALLIGKANMHEIGIGVTGLNPHHGAARNAYDPQHATGGSSSGSAAAVAMGLCPVAVGADGGGSIRVPAALCGQVGLKATFGRVSEHGAAELCWSVAHVGPIGATVRDVALAYAAMAGPDDKDPGSLLQPEPQLDGIGDADLSGLKVGVYTPWFEDASSDVVAACRRGVDALRKAGAKVVEITIPELEVARVAHLVTIVAEMTAAHLGHYARQRDAYGLDTRLNLALGRRMQGFDYIHAQRHRTRVWRHFAEVLEQVDVIATPTSGITAPPLPADALETGESNLEVTGAIMRFAFPGNLTGLPAISVPAGYDRNGLPVGLQLMGRAWHEHLLLRMARVVELATERERPAVWYGYL
jgi:Asp-tRNA(Asn)/Glu-tRNA(Gln) amidotransferase A subunit family amidase